MMACRFLLAGVLGTALAPACAQLGDASLLPEGSHEVRIGAVLANAPAALGSSKRSTVLLPQFSAEWSNGVFLEGLLLGKQMSTSSQWKYGPLLALGMAAQHGEGDGRTLRPVVGAFLRYRPARELGLQAHVLAPASRAGTGTLLNLSANTQAGLGPHHWLAFGLGANVADRAYMQSDFGSARYRAAGGVRDVFAEARWGWQLTPKVLLQASLHASRLQGDAAASPFTRQRSAVANALAFSYSY
jgi:MipA family protein